MRVSFAGMPCDLGASSARAMRHSSCHHLRTLTTVTARPHPTKQPASGLRETQPRRCPNALKTSPRHAASRPPLCSYHRPAVAGAHRFFHPPPPLRAIACRRGQAQGVRMGLIDTRCKVAARGATLASRYHASLPPNSNASGCALWCLCGIPGGMHTPAPCTSIAARPCG